MRHSLRLLLLLFLTSTLAGPATARPPKKSKTTAYLFAYFTGNAKQEEAIRFALSPDGYHYTALNGNRPILSSAAISETGGATPWRPWKPTTPP